MPEKAGVTDYMRLVTLYRFEPGYTWCRFPNPHTCSPTPHFDLKNLLIYYNILTVIHRKKKQ